MTDNALKNPLSATLGGFTDRRANDFTHIQAKSLPCRVVKVEKDIITIAFEGDNKVWTMPQRKIPQAFSAYGREPTQVGDKGYASPGDFHLGGISGLGHNTADWTRRGNLTPLVFHPISKVKSEERDYDQYTGAGGPKGMKFIQQAKPPKDDPSKPPDGQPTPKLMRKMIGWGNASRSAWLRRIPPPPVVEPLADDDRSFMEIDKDGVITHHSKTGKHAAIVDEANQNVALKAPLTSKVHLGGDGKEGSFLQVMLIDMTPSKNVFARKA